MNKNELFYDIFHKISSTKEKTRRMALPETGSFGVEWKPFFWLTLEEDFLDKISLDYKNSDIMFCFVLEDEARKE